MLRPLKCVCGNCVICQSRERQRMYRADSVAIERLRANDRRRSRNPKRMADNTRKTRERRLARPEEYRARTAVSNALRDGRLERGPCECASEDCSGRVEAHHDDYSRPLDVRWLCVRHHRIQDSQQRRAV